MTPEEKTSFLHGIPAYSSYGGIIRGVPRLGIPPLLMNNGPFGFTTPPAALLRPDFLLPFAWMQRLFVYLTYSSSAQSSGSTGNWVFGNLFSDSAGGNILCNRGFDHSDEAALRWRAGEVFSVFGGNPCSEGRSSTALPTPLAVAATFSRRAAAANADVLAREFIQKGANMVLGPALNMQRVPFGGRNFENLAGEDPVLGAELAKVGLYIYIL